MSDTKTETRTGHARDAVARDTVAFEVTLPKPKARQNAVMFIGAGLCVMFEGRANGGGDLIMEKGVPVKMGDAPTDVVSQEFAALLVAEGKAEYAAVTESPEVTPPPESLESAKILPPIVPAAGNAVSAAVG